MSDNTSQKSFTVREIYETRDFWLQKSYISEGLGQELRAADVLMVPQEKFRDQEGLFFPEGTSEFLPFLQDNIKDFKVDICIEDEDYRELAIHNTWVDLGIWVATSIAAPLLVYWLQQRLERSRVADDTKVTCRIIVQQNLNGDRALQATYDGPMSGFSSTFEPFVNNFVSPSASPSLSAADGEDDVDTSDVNQNADDNSGDPHLSDPRP
jgi:hypothetical protein